MLVFPVPHWEQGIPIFWESKFQAVLSWGFLTAPAVLPEELECWNALAGISDCPTPPWDFILCGVSTKFSLLAGILGPYHIFIPFSCCQTGMFGLSASKVKPSP